MRRGPTAFNIAAIVLGLAFLYLPIVLLVVYVVLGSYALKRAQTRRGRLLCFVAALATYAYMYSVARAHHPAGVFWLLQG